MWVHQPSKPKLLIWLQTSSPVPVLPSTNIPPLPYPLAFLLESLNPTWTLDALSSLNLCTGKTPIISIRKQKSAFVVLEKKALRWWKGIFGLHGWATYWSEGHQKRLTGIVVLNTGRSQTVHTCSPLPSAVSGWRWDHWKAAETVGWLDFK